MKSLFYSIFLCITSLLAKGQTSFPFLKDDTLLKSKYSKDVLLLKETLFSSFNKKTEKEYKEIYTTSFKNIQEFITGKASVTEVNVNNYLQLLVREIVQNNKELSKLNLRVLFSRDWWPNAYSMGDGTIAINAGIIVFLQNEAELAFIICHELAHYYLKHSTKSIDKYVQTINSEVFQKELKDISKKEFGVNKALEKLSKGVVFNSRKHSRDNEAEADYYAYKFISKTNFNANGIITCLQLLDKIDDSLLTKPLQINLVLNNSSYPFKKRWIEEESSIFSEMKNDDVGSKNENDSLKTHPDCTKRIALLKDSISLISNASKKYFTSSEVDFTKLKNKIFIESIEYCYDNNQFSRNLYYTLLLLQEKKEEPFAIYSIARCFNAIYEKQKNHKLGLAIDVENNQYNSDYNLLLKMLSRLSLPEIAAINYHFCKTNLTAGLTYKGFEQEWQIAQKNNNNF
jgi:Zn-dependent protease with chaperone function